MEEVDDQLDDGGADEQAYGDHQGTAWAQKPDPMLQAFSKTLPNKVDRLHSGHELLDESTEMSDADTFPERRHAVHVSAGHEGDALAFEDPRAGFAMGNTSRVGAFGEGAGGTSLGSSAISSRPRWSGVSEAEGGRELGVSGGMGRESRSGAGGGFFGAMSRNDIDGDERVADRSSLMVRPRGVKKELLMPLRVAQTVSRMGKEVLHIYTHTHTHTHTHTYIYIYIYIYNI
jgi:hypothetical protein